MKAIAKVLASRPEPFMVATMLLNIASIAVTVTRFSLNADVSSFMSEGNAAGEAYTALNAKYTTSEPIQILASLPAGQTFNTSDALVKLASLAANVSNVTGVASVSTFLPPTDPLTGTDLSHDAAKVANWPDPVITTVADSMIASLLLSTDKRHTLIMATPCSTCVGMDVATALTAEVDAAGFVPTDLTTRLSGNPVIFATVISMLSCAVLAPGLNRRRKLLFFVLRAPSLMYVCVCVCVAVVLFLIPPALIVLLLGIFYASIGSLRLTFFSVLPAIFGSLWTFGVIFSLGLQIDVVTIIVPIFVVVMGSADGLHFVMHFQEEIHRTTDKAERVETTLTQVGIPMILTTISTIAGFLSLCFTGVRPIVQMGAFAATGIGFAGVISFFFLPALLSKVHLEPGSGRRPPCCPKPRSEGAGEAAGEGAGGGATASGLDEVGPGGGTKGATGPASAAAAAAASKSVQTGLSTRLVAALKWVVARRAIALLLSVGLAAFSAVFIPRLSVDTDQLFFFKDGHAIRTNFELTQTIFGGATPLMGEFAFDAASTNLTGRLAELRHTTTELEALPGVRRVFSMADVVPTNAPEASAAALLDPNADASGSPLGKMVTPDGLRFILFPGAFGNAEVEGWQAYQRSHSRDVRTLTGMPIIWADVAKLVLKAQLESLGWAFGLVTILLLGTYRDVRLTIIALIPLALTVALVLGFVAASGMKLNLVTAIISSIVIGVGIDYSIHFIAAINYAKNGLDGGGQSGYVLRAIEKAGRPILANALGISAALSALWVSPLKTHGEISIIMWIAMLPAALTTLLVIPALLPSKGLTEPGAVTDTGSSSVTSSVA